MVSTVTSPVTTDCLSFRGLEFTVDCGGEVTSSLGGVVTIDGLDVEEW